MPIQILPQTGLRGTLPDAAFRGLTELQYLDCSGAIICLAMHQAWCAMNFWLVGAQATSCTTGNSLAGVFPESLAESLDLVFLNMATNYIEGETHASTRVLAPTERGASPKGVLNFGKPHLSSAGTLPQDLLNSPVFKTLQMVCCSCNSNC